MAIFLSLFFALFIIYLLSRDDYSLLRKNISLDSVFNLAFLVLFGSLFFSRVFFILFHWKPIYENPLVFLLISSYSGLSFPGSIVGGMIILSALSLKKKLPTGRLFDIFSLSSLLGIFMYVFFNIIYLFFTKRNAVLLESVVFLCYVSLFVFCLVLFKSERWKDGFVGSLQWILFSLFMIIATFLGTTRVVQLIVPDLILYGIIFVASVGILVGSSNISFPAVKKR